LTVKDNDRKEYFGPEQIQRRGAEDAKGRRGRPGKPADGGQAWTHESGGKPPQSKGKQIKTLLCVSWRSHRFFDKLLYGKKYQNMTSLNVQIFSLIV